MHTFIKKYFKKEQIFLISKNHFRKDESNYSKSFTGFCDSQR